MAAKKKWLDCFVPHRLEMLLHPTWMFAPIPLRRMLERLEVEHLRHGGYKNGEMYVSFRQFEGAGISHRKILATMNLGETLGLLRVIRSDEYISDLRAPNAYRLTYLPTKSAPPTDEWKAMTEERARSAIEAFHEIERRRAKPRLRAVA